MSSDPSQSLAGTSKNLRGRPTDSPEVRTSKTLSYILRHGAAKEGLHMRPDGYIRVKDLLARPKLQGVDLSMLQDIVKNNDKQRYQLVFEEPAPIATDNTPSASPEGEWWIRANQGHSVKVESLELQAITSPEQLPVAVHGTTEQAWKSIETQGLSKMNRNHIHLATGLPSAGVKSGMRTSSTVLIYINVPLALSRGIPFHLSANGVILSEGDADGFIRPEFFERVEHVEGSRPERGEGGGNRGRGGRGRARGRGGRGPAAVVAPDVANTA